MEYQAEQFYLKYESYYWINYFKIFAHIYFELGDWVSTYAKSWRKDQQMHEPKPQLNNARVVP